MKKAPNELIDELIAETENMISVVEGYKSLTLDQLNFKKTPESWNILECLEHINLYSDFYIPEFSQKITSSKFPAVEMYKSGLFGNYAANSMLIKNGKPRNKMNTFKHMNPINQGVKIEAIEKFIAQQKSVIKLLEKARLVNLSKTKCNTTLKYLKFSLGDTLRFYINHNIRHIHQANLLI